MQQRKTVTVTIKEGVSLYDLLDECTPDDAIQKMEEYKDFYSGREIRFKVGYCGYDGGVVLDIIETRLETDKEYDKRIKVEEKQAGLRKAAKVKSEEQERKEYERLKKKYE